METRIATLQMQSDHHNNFTLVLLHSSLSSSARAELMHDPAYILDHFSDVIRARHIPFLCRGLQSRVARPLPPIKIHNRMHALVKFEYI